MTKVTKTLLAILALALSALLWFLVNWKILHDKVPILEEKVNTLEQQQSKVTESKLDDQKLVTFITDLMIITGAKITGLQKTLTIEAIVRVSKKHFDTFEKRKAFAALLAIESKFDKNARNPSTASGMSQVLERYAQYFSDKCNLGEISKNDLFDTEANLELGACNFADLIDTFNGNIPLALAGYNSGQNSESVKQMKALVNVKNVETSSYVLKYSMLTAMLENKEKNKLDINEEWKR